jgi:hypothetical protein
MLLLAPAGGLADWPAERWQGLPGRIRTSLPALRTAVVPPLTPATAAKRAALVAAADVVLASDQPTVELALLCGTPVVALGRPADSLPSRPGVQGLGVEGELAQLPDEAVLQALGLTA